MQEPLLASFWDARGLASSSRADFRRRHQKARGLPPRPPLGVKYSACHLAEAGDSLTTPCSVPGTGTAATTSSWRKETACVNPCWVSLLAWFTARGVYIGTTWVVRLGGALSPTLTSDIPCMCSNCRIYTRFRTAAFAAVAGRRVRQQLSGQSAVGKQFIRRRRRRWR